MDCDAILWERFCDTYGWDPLLHADFAAAHPDIVTERLSIFQSWVYPQLRGRGRDDAKPRTVFDGYVLAIIRTLGREHLPMPKAKHVEKSLAGLMRSFKQIYGVQSVVAQCKGVRDSTSNQIDC